MQACGAFEFGTFLAEQCGGGGGANSSKMNLDERNVFHFFPV